MILSKEVLDHKAYYTDGKVVGRWDAVRNIFWFWNDRNSIRTLSYVRHSDDDIFGFAPKSSVRQETVFDPIIFS